MSQPAARNLPGLLSAFLVASLVAGVLGAGLFLPLVGAAGVSASKSVDFFDALPADLAQPPLSERSRMLAADGKTVLATFYDENRITVELDQISQPMQQAIVAIEDARFYQHTGIDPQGLARAAVTNKLRSGASPQGASTLTQQLVKNVLLESALARGDEAGMKAANEVTPARKLREVRYALALEQKMSKQEILNRYLNIVWFGGKINGVQAAARHYFNTSAAKLTLPQAAVLAGMVQQPQRYNPVTNPENATSRRNTVLKAMVNQGMITQEEYTKARDSALTTDEQPERSGCANSPRQYAWFCDYVVRQLQGNKQFAALGKTPEERLTTLNRGGLTIHTTLQPKVAKAAWSAVTSTISPTDASKVATASVSVEPETGKVLSITQNRIYDPAGGKGRTSLNYAVDFEYGGAQGFQTGSTFKPFTLATWLKEGKSLNAVVNAAATPAPMSQFTSCGSRLPNTGTYNFNNAEGSASGSRTVFEGTYKSINGVYVSMEKELDLCDIRETAESLGVHLASPRDDVCKVGDQETDRLPICVPSLTLGVELISPMTMAGAFGAFANEGMFCKPIVVDQILDRDDQPISVPEQSCKRALSKKVADTVTYGLSRVLNPEGTAARAGRLSSGRPASGKTGTTDESRATWFVGYTPQISTAVWVGDPSSTKDGRPRSLNRRTIGGTYYSRVYGGTIAAPIWKKIMERSLEGEPVQRFGAADAELMQRPGVPVPDVAGRSIADALATLQAAGFEATTGAFVSSPYPVGAAAGTTPGGGTRLERGSTVTVQVSSGPAIDQQLPPQAQEQLERTRQQLQDLANNRR